MVTILARPYEQHLGPAEITPSNVRFWSDKTELFERSQVGKARRFVENGCIEQVAEDRFICKPIEGYNKRTYFIRKNKHGFFECSCQRGQKEPENCSHILALHYAEKIGKREILQVIA